MPTIEEQLSNAQSLISSMKDKLKQQDEILKELNESAKPNPYMIVLQINGDKALLLEGSKQYELNIEDSRYNLSPGDIVCLHGETGGIVKVEHKPVPLGPIAVVRRTISSVVAEIETQSGTRTVIYSDNYVDEINPDDRVVLDLTGNVILKNLGKKEETFTFQDSTGVSWSDIGGLDEAKQRLKDIIELPYMNRRIFQRYGMKPSKGVMLYGPPGCGKTLLAKATASALAEIHGQDTMSTGLIYIKGPEILSKWVGESEATIRSLFARARSHYDQEGYPATIFIDEADAVLARRGTGRSSDMEKTIVPQFLSEMDGLKETGQPLVILATNRSDTLDPAVVRDGRIDTKIEIPRPVKEQSEAIFAIHFKNRPVAEDGLISKSSVLLFEEPIYIGRTRKDELKHFTLGNLVNGAMIANVVNNSALYALHRELKKTGPRGITTGDVIRAVQDAKKEHKHTDHRDELKLFVEKHEIVEIVEA